MSNNSNIDSMYEYPSDETYQLYAIYRYYTDDNYFDSTGIKDISNKATLDNENTPLSQQTNVAYDLFLINEKKNTSKTISLHIKHNWRIERGELVVGCNIENLITKERYNEIVFGGLQYEILMEYNCVSYPSLEYGPINNYSNLLFKTMKNVRSLPNNRLYMNAYVNTPIMLSKVNGKIIKELNNDKNIMKLEKKYRVLKSVDSNRIYIKNDLYTIKDIYNTIDTTVSRYKRRLINYKPIVGYLISKSRLYPHDSQYTKLKTPCSFSFKIQDHTGHIICQVWNELAFIIYNNLNLGDLLYIENYRTNIRPDFLPDDINNSVELKLNSSNPSCKILSIRPNQINIPSMQSFLKENNQSRYHILNLKKSYRNINNIYENMNSIINDNICVIGIIVYISSLQREYNKITNQYYFYRTLLIQDQDDNDSLLLPIFLYANSIQDILQTLSVNNMVCITNLNMIQQSSSSFYLKSSFFTHIFHRKTTIKSFNLINYLELKKIIKNNQFHPYDTRSILKDYQLLNDENINITSLNTLSSLIDNTNIFECKKLLLQGNVINVCVYANGCAPYLLEEEEEGENNSSDDNDDEHHTQKVKKIFATLQSPLLKKKKQLLLLLKVKVYNNH